LRNALDYGYPLYARQLELFMDVLSIPALVVGGRQDNAIPIRLIEEVHRILAGSRLEVIDQAGRCPHDEQAAHFNRVALEFLKGYTSKSL